VIVSKKLVTVLIVFGIVGIGTVLAFQLESIESSKIESKPNIVIVNTDDLSLKEFETALHNEFLPNLKSLIIDEGTTFTNAFVSSTTCCPSRATFFTGQYVHNHGVFANSDVIRYLQFKDGVKQEELYEVLMAPGGILAFDDSSTITTWLHDDGYTTGHFGKYLNGYGVDTSQTYIPPGWDDWQTMITGGSDYFKFYQLNNNGVVEVGIEDPMYLTDKLAMRAVNFIQKSEEKNQSFFLVIDTTTPHSSVVSDYHCDYDKSGLHGTVPNTQYVDTADSIFLPRSPSFNEEDVSDKIWRIQKLALLNNTTIDCFQEVFREKLEAMRSVDDLIGTVFQALDEIEALSNTIIIFTSDHGFYFGEHRLALKIYPYEEVIRVPLIIRVPGLEKQTIDHLVVNTDLVPTIADFAGVDPAIPVDGVSLKSLLENPKKDDWRNGFLVEGYVHTTPFHGIRYQNGSSGYFYVEFTYIEGKFGQLPGETCKSDCPPMVEFYSLADDPYQLDGSINCTSEKCVENIAQIKKWLEELKQCGNGSCQKIEKRVLWEKDT